jgi:quercetin dioxygenase-like cupin family protein
MTDSAYKYCADLAGEVEVPSDGTLSRTLHQDDTIKVVLFGFAAGQELSEHTAAVPAIMHFLKGEASVLLGADRHDVQEGAWFLMPANLPHSITAKTPVVMLLSLLKSGAR